MVLRSLSLRVVEQQDGGALLLARQHDDFAPGGWEQN
ncbi:hypothetical protein PSAB6_580014 [Paraburkholderia sabiae]|nr:hypothetical protein PSAB6_580014 [Paraburkholderia sabiae]